ncbi:MAG: hypothetical protein NT027_14255 [Proteobacteria bacterium]|nr:hypothetical protein [Pseudomonadota bacterium]
MHKIRIRNALLALVCICATAFSCKSSNDRENKLNKMLEVNSPSEIYPSIGKKSFFGDPKTQFNFGETALSPSNAFWLALMSTIAYGENRDIDEYLRKIMGNKIKKFHFFDPRELEGKGAESFFLHTEGGWIVSFRGSWGGKDWITNFKRMTLKTRGINQDGEFDDLRIHSGFYDMGSAVFEHFIQEYLSASKSIDYKYGSDESFKAVDMLLRGMALESDVYADSRPDDVYLPFIQKAKSLGLLKSETPDIAILNALSIWSEELAAVGRARNGQPQVMNGTDGYKAIEDKSQSRKRSAAQKIERYFVFRKYEPIWLTGHSCGGASATILAHRLSRLGIPFAGLVTFGAPKVGNAVFVAEMNETYKLQSSDRLNARFHYNQDLIPLVPKLEGIWKHTTDSWFVSSTDLLHIPATESSRELLKSKWPENRNGKSVKFYESENQLPDQTGIFNTDLLLKNHNMSKYYFNWLDQYTSGT